MFIIQKFTVLFTEKEIPHLFSYLIYSKNVHESDKRKCFTFFDINPKRVSK